MVASKLFQEEDRKAVSTAVAEAEKKTSAEIVPVVATASDRYERAEDILGLVFVAAALAVTWPYLHQIAPASDWGESETFVLQLPAVVGVIMVGWLLGMNLAKRIPWLKRLGVSRGVMTARVLIAAHHAFDSLHVHKTAGGTGVVIYVSLFEHRVCVWADRTVSAKIPESEWKEITEGLVRALGEGKPREGLVEAIRKCGEVLGKHFPVKPRDVNELPNELRILD